MYLFCGDCFLPSQTSLSPEGGLSSGFPQAGLGSASGVKLEAVMEQLQKQQQAKLEMERKERHLREAQILYAQQVAAQQAILANARAQGGAMPPEFYGKNSRDRALKAGAGHLPSRVATQSSVESMREEEEEDDDEEEDEEDMERRRGSEGEEEEDEEMVEGEEGSEEDEGEGLEFLRKQSLALQQAAAGVAPYPFPVYTASPSAAKKRPRSPGAKVKDEPEDKSLSPSGPHTFSTPNGTADWSFDESFKQVRQLKSHLPALEQSHRQVLVLIPRENDSAASDSCL